MVKPLFRSRKNDVCQPLSSYALAKLNCEEYIRLYCKNFGINGGAFKFFNFGEGLKRQIIYDLFKKCKSDSSTLDLYEWKRGKRYMLCGCKF